MGGVVGHRWSPWFVGIMERKGWEYWQHLEEAMEEGRRGLQLVHG